MDDGLLKQNRHLVDKILSKVKEQKLDELTDEELVYTQILFNNNFIDKNGNVTDDGKKAILH